MLENWFVSKMETKLARSAVADRQGIVAKAMAFFEQKHLFVAHSGRLTHASRASGGFFRPLHDGLAKRSLETMSGLCTGG